MWGGVQRGTHQRVSIFMRQCFTCVSMAEALIFDVGFGLGSSTCAMHATWHRPLSAAQRCVAWPTFGLCVLVLLFIVQPVAGMDFSETASVTDAASESGGEYKSIMLAGVSVFVMVKECKLCGGKSIDANPLFGAKCHHRNMHMMRHLPWLKGTLEAPVGNFCALCYAAFFAAGFGKIYKKISAFREKAEKACPGMHMRCFPIMECNLCFCKFVSGPAAGT